MTPFERGRQDCGLDEIENAPFSSIGGPYNRKNPRAPDYINDNDITEYLRGYVYEAKALYGEDWQTAKFEWKRVLDINPTCDKCGEELIFIESLRIYSCKKCDIKYKE